MIVKNIQKDLEAHLLPMTSAVDSFYKNSFVVSKINLQEFVKYTIQKLPELIKKFSTPVPESEIKWQQPTLEVTSCPRHQWIAESYVNADRYIIKSISEPGDKYGTEEAIRVSPGDTVTFEFKMKMLTTPQFMIRRDTKINGAIYNWQVDGESTAVQIVKRKIPLEGEAVEMMDHVLLTMQLGEVADFFVRSCRSEYFCKLSNKLQKSDDHTSNCFCRHHLQINVSLLQVRSQQA